MTKMQKPQVGPRIVRAWFDTIFNPLLEALAIEKHLVDRKDWTWRYHHKDFELLLPVEYHLNEGGRTNLEQFLEIERDVAPAVEEHDSALSDLRSACSEFQERLVTTIEQLHQGGQGLPPEMSQRTAQFPTETIKPDLEQIAKQSPPLKISSLLAQYIVNHKDRIDPFAITYEFWKKHSRHYLALLEQEAPFIQEPYRKTLQAGRRLEKAIDRLASTLRDLRSRLSLTHDVPYVEQTRDRNT